MQLALPGRPHLTYCTNIHPGETWADIRAALETHLPEVKREISPAAPMGVGLRLSAVAARDLTNATVQAQFQRFLADADLYVFTINAFPYGSFHGTRVKERVYAPDWRTQERLAYTSQVADILSILAPDGMAASISTVPGAFRAEITGEPDIERIVEGFVRAAAHLHLIRQQTGRTITLAIEPEPACLLETTDEAIRFISEHLFGSEARANFARLTGISVPQAEECLRRHIGLCFDVCHSAVAFEETVPMLERVLASGISIAKLQISTALTATGDPSQFEPLLARFDDGIYLHQTVECCERRMIRHTDLPDAFVAARRGGAQGEWRVHCHVPVFIDRFGDLGSTQQSLRDALALCRKREVSAHLEVETYTWNVLPEELRSTNIVGDIVRELRWVRQELGA